MNVPYRYLDEILTSDTGAKRKPKLQLITQHFRHPNEFCSQNKSTPVRILCLMA
jgi:hypothetical protein